MVDILKPTDVIGNADESKLEALRAKINSALLEDRDCLNLTGVLSVPLGEKPDFACVRAVMQELTGAGWEGAELDKDSLQKFFLFIRTQGLFRR